MDKKTKIIVSSVAAVAVVAIIAVVCVLVLGGNSEAKQAEKAVSTFFGALQKGNFEEANKYVVGDLLANEGADELFNSQDAMKVMCQGLKCEIVSSNGSEGKYTVKAKITNKSFKDVFSKYMTKAFSLAFSQAFNANATEEDMTKQMAELLVEQYNSDEVQTATTEVDFTVSKNSEGNWIIGGEETAILEALLPGYTETMNSISSLSEQMSGEE